MALKRVNSLSEASESSLKPLVLRIDLELFLNEVTIFLQPSG